MSIQLSYKNIAIILGLLYLFFYCRDLFKQPQNVEIMKKNMNLFLATANSSIMNATLGKVNIITFSTFLRYFFKNKLGFFLMINSSIKRFSKNKNLVLKKENFKTSFFLVRPNEFGFFLNPNSLGLTLKSWK